MTVQVIFTARANKQISRAPSHIADKLMNWAEEVELRGLNAVRGRKGYHDEPLQGYRFGQRSIRLSRQWRAIYRQEGEDFILIYVLELTPHAYKR